jgi:hypothetical protein
MKVSISADIVAYERPEMLDVYKARRAMLNVMMMRSPV